jgi:amidase
MQTTAEFALEGNHASNDALSLSRLREAGAIIIGKTNLRNGQISFHTVMFGWRTEATKQNPYILDHNPCGSRKLAGGRSSKSLRCSCGKLKNGWFCVCPSAVSGIVGIKPTVGLVSRSGIIPISHTQDIAGPMARTVKDAAILLEY